MMVGAVRPEGRLVFGLTARRYRAATGSRTSLRDPALPLDWRLAGFLQRLCRAAWMSRHDPAALDCSAYSRLGFLTAFRRGVSSGWKHQSVTAACCLSVWTRAKSDACPLHSAQAPRASHLDASVRGRCALVAPGATAGPPRQLLHPFASGHSEIPSGWLPRSPGMQPVLLLASGLGEHLSRLPSAASSLL